jgi:flagellar hook assembly protein FlgD
MKPVQKIVSVVILQTAFAAMLFAYNPTVGGDSIGTFLSPDLLGGNTSVTGGAFDASLPGELAVNPAIGAGEQRIIVDASYAALLGLGGETGFGHVVNLGLLAPLRWSVVSGSLNFVNSPFASIPLGTAGTLHAAISKDLTDKLYIGAGLTASAGTGWGVSGELGVLYKLGDLGVLKDAKVAGALTGIGRTFVPTTGTGINGGDSSGYASPFTPRAGFAATLLKTDAFKLGASADLSAPSCQNLALDTGLEAVIMDVVTVKSGWNVNLIETVNAKQTYIPSLAVAVNLKLNSAEPDSFLAKNGWGQSDITPTLAVKPLYNGITAVGGGVNVHLGVTDTKAPTIAIDYPSPLYISPNNDGTQDELSFGVKIADQRYVLAWSFVIENADGTVIRTIANKEQRPEMQDLGSFWKLLTRVKAGIALPDSLRWDGVMDSGDKAPDGTYSFYVTATDDNGNKGTSDKYTVYVDNTAPVVTATPPTGANAMIFSPDGDGNKDTFKIAQTGSVEDLWKAEISNSAATVVRTVETKNAAPADFVWDGKNDASSIVPDGVYSYKIAVKDRAGNTAQARVDNIIVDTEKPSINVSIDSAAFSPNGDGVKDTVVLTPSVPVLTGLIQWNVTVNAKAGGAIRTYSGTTAPKAIVFDGKKDSGEAAAEGDYQAVITARYINGYAPEARSPFFNLDVTAPEAQVRASGPIFSPVGDGKLDTVTFTQQAGVETAWTGEIFALGTDGKATGKAIRTIQLGGTPDAKLVWDGRDDTGKLAPDGKYGYRLTSTDKAGNTGVSNVAAVELNTEKADLILQANLAAFSPNGDGAKDTITFTPIIKAATAVAQYSLTVKDSSGKVVKTFAGTGKVPASFSWNGVCDPASGETTGIRAPDGVYGAALDVTLVNQQTSHSAAPDFTIDTVYPAIEVSAPYVVFSPNGDKNRDTLPVTQVSSDEDLWTAKIVSDKKTVVKAFSWNGKAANFEWDATDDSGNKVANGAYTYVVTSEDRAGNKTERQLAGIAVDARTPKAYITAELPAFSPNGDGVKDTQKLAIVTSVPDGLASWSVAIKPEGTADAPAVKGWDSENGTALPATITWDGKDASGATVLGNYVAVLTIAYAKGDVVTASTPAFLVNAKAPVLNVKLSPKYFSPDNDGVDDELTIGLTASSASQFTDWSFEIREPAGSKGNVFWKTAGTGKITDRIIWDGRSLKGELVQAATDYPFTFTVTDEVGMTSVVKGYIPIDVLIIRDGDKLKIAVPSIIFRENEADFVGLDPAVVDKNTAVLKRIAEILNKFRDYKVEVEGHANNVTGTQKEEDAELIPLSLKRAKAVKDFLVANGVDATRLSSVGMGGTRPVAQRSDKENWWKNRRVEFILIK